MDLNVKGAHAILLIEEFVGAMLARDAESQTNNLVTKMVDFAMGGDDLQPVDPDLMYKAQVSHLMCLARQFRHASPEAHDAAYKCLQNQLYAFLKTNDTRH